MRLLICVILFIFGFSGWAHTPPCSDKKNLADFQLPTKEEIAVAKAKLNDSVKGVGEYLALDGKSCASDGLIMTYKQVKAGSADKQQALRMVKGPYLPAPHVSKVRWNLVDLGMQKGLWTMDPSVKPKFKELGSRMREDEKANRVDDEAMTEEYARVFYRQTLKEESFGKELDVFTAALK
jgi:hypothetical protein